MAPTHREQVLKRLGLDLKEGYSLEELSRKAKVPLKILQEV